MKINLSLAQPELYINNKEYELANDLLEKYTSNNISEKYIFIEDFFKKNKHKVKQATLKVLIPTDWDSRNEAILINLLAEYKLESINFIYSIFETLLEKGLNLKSEHSANCIWDFQADTSELLLIINNKIVSYLKFNKSLAELNSRESYMELEKCFNDFFCKLSNNNKSLITERGVVISGVDEYKSDMYEYLTKQLNTIFIYI